MFSRTKAVASGAAQQMSVMPGAQKVIGVGQTGLVNQGAKVPVKLLGIILFLTILFVSTSAMGIGIYNKCEKAKNSKKWTNIKNYWSHTLASVLGIFCTLIILNSMKGKKEVAALQLMLGCMGMIGGAMLIPMINDCSPKDKQGKLGGAGALLALNICCIILGFMAFTGTKKPVLQRQSAMPKGVIPSTVQ